MNDNFTKEYWDGTLDIYYKTWEEIPVSTLNFGNTTSQICYVSLVKEKAIEAYTTKAIPANTVAYEYVENIKKKDDEVILAVEINTEGMMDLTNRNDYMQYMKCKAANEKLNSEIALIRRVIVDNATNQFVVIYNIRDNRCVKDIIKKI